LDLIEVLEPNIFLNLWYGDTTRWFKADHAANKAGEPDAEPPRAAVVAAVDHVVHVGVLVIEGKVACHEPEEEDAASPDVGLGAIIAAALEHLRCDEHGRAADGVELRLALSVRAESPKSATLMLPTASSRMLSGLISRWYTPSEWQ
jgi:hypothetical protein